MTTFTVEKPNSSDYLIDGQADPTLTLVRGQSYTFDFKGDGHPFYIKSMLGPGTTGRYDTGVVNQGSSSASLDLLFTVPNDAPDLLYYQCSAHPNMQGQLQLVSSQVPVNTGSSSSSVSVIVAPGYLGPGPLLLGGIVEERSDDTWTLQYLGKTYNHADIDEIITIVTRDEIFTSEFSAEIADAYPEYTGITYAETVALVGINSVNNILIAVAGADGEITN